LGTELVDVLKEHTLIPLTHSDIEITDQNQVRTVLLDFTPKLVINTAAYHDVGECEKNDLRAFQINAKGVKNIAIACKEVDSALLHISTDYIFDGRAKMPYVEIDLPNPLNVYGISKLMGEYYLKSILNAHFIVRTSGLYGMHKCRVKKGGSFIDQMLLQAKERNEIQVVKDQILTPTYTLDLANQIRELIKTQNYGTYHVTNAGQCSWYEFAKAIFEISRINVNLKGVSSTEFPSTVKRPPYSVLENRALYNLGIDIMNDWKSALTACLKAKKII